MSRSQALPSTGRCPRCNRNTLLILPDRASGGQWHWCRKCQFSGDMIELAARVWESSIEATIYRLKRENFSITTDHDEISHYVEKHLKVRKRMLQLWQIARENIYTTSHDVAVLLQNLQLKTPTEHPRWEQSCGQLVGCIHSHRVEEMIVPSGFIRRDGGSD